MRSSHTSARLKLKSPTVPSAGKAVEKPGLPGAAENEQEQTRNAQPPGETVWQLLKQLTLQLPSHPTLSPEYVPSEAPTPLLVAAFPVTAHSWTRLKCPSPGERTDRPSPPTRARECYLAIKGMNSGPYSNVGESQNDHTKRKRAGQTEKSSDCMAPLLQHSRFSSVAQSCPTLCDRMDCSTLGFPVHHQLPELAQTHVHQVSDAIPPLHPLSSLLLLPLIFPSISIFSNESVLPIRWPKLGHQSSTKVELQLQH